MTMTDDGGGGIAPRFGFLLGAGASKSASVPDMIEFSPLFLTKMQNEHPNVYSYLEDVLGQYLDDDAIDLEEFMVTLQTLANRIPYNEIIQKIRPFPNKLSGNIEIANEALQLLEQYIAECTFVNDQSRIQYLYGLSDVIWDMNYYPPIFTVNYDTIIELLCTRNGIKYVDGFNPYWDSSLFDDADGIRLYKLHGSCTWYSSGPAYVKLPTGPIPPHLELLGGGRIQNILLYPEFSKDRSNEPLSVLLDFFRQELRRLDILFIVGYSCRDLDISMAIAEGMRENPNLQLYVISKHPTKSLELLAQVEPRIKDNAICISTTWEQLLETGRLGRLINDYYISFESFREWQINSRYGQISSRIEKAEELRQSFQYKQLNELYQSGQHSTTARIGPPVQILFESSLGLLYKSILYDDIESVKKFSNTLLTLINKRIGGRDETVTFQSIIQSIPQEFNIGVWESNVIYQLHAICDFSLFKWAEWIEPFLYDERFTTNLRILSASIQISYDDFESLESLSQAFQSARGIDRRHTLSQAERHIKTTISRLAIPITIDELVRYVPDVEENTLHSLLSNYEWIGDIFFDGVENTRIFYSTLIDMADVND
jgi:hypothetical protein